MADRSCSCSSDRLYSVHRSSFCLGLATTTSAVAIFNFNLRNTSSTNFPPPPPPNLPLVKIVTSLLMFVVVLALIKIRMYSCTRFSFSIYRDVSRSHWSVNFILYAKKRNSSLIGGFCLALNVIKRFGSVHFFFFWFYLPF